MNTIIDADVLVGLFDTTDAHNKEAQRLLEELTRRGINTLILPTTIGEFAAISTRDVGMKEAQEATSKVLHSGITIIEVDKDLTLQAIAIYLKQDSRKETLFDCFVMAAAKM